jgi:hypothetical protein
VAYDSGVVTEAGRSGGSQVAPQWLWGRTVRRLYGTGQQLQSEGLHSNCSPATWVALAVKSLNETLAPALAAKKPLRSRPSPLSWMRFSDDGSRLEHESGDRDADVALRHVVPLEPVRGREERREADRAVRDLVVEEPCADHSDHAIHRGRPDTDALGRRVEARQEAVIRVVLAPPGRGAPSAGVLATPSRQEDLLEGVAVAHQRRCAAAHPVVARQAVPRTTAEGHAEGVGADIDLVVGHLQVVDHVDAVQDLGELAVDDEVGDRRVW